MGNKTNTCVIIKTVTLDLELDLTIPHATFRDLKTIQHKIYWFQLFISISL